MFICIFRLGNNRRFLITKKLSSKSVHLKELRKHLGNISLLTVNLYSTVKVEQEMEKRKKHHETFKRYKKFDNISFENKVLNFLFICIQKSKPSVQLNPVNLISLFSRIWVVRDLLIYPRVFSRHSVISCIQTGNNYPLLRWLKT